MKYLNHEVITKDLSLRKTSLHGDWLLTLCPFKHYSKERGNYLERNPSLGINLHKASYTCFSCGAAGSIEDLSRYMGKKLSPMAMIRVPDIKRIDTKQVTFATEKMLTMNQEKSLTYLQKRGIETPNCLHGSNADGSEVYLAFHGYSGKLGWLTRYTKGEARWRKYPEDFDYTKNFYGFDNINISNEELYITESTMDCIFMNSLGFPTISTCGGYVSNWHTGWILDKCKSVILLPQNDFIGQRWLYWMLRGLAFRIPMKAVILPEKYKDFLSAGKEVALLAASEPSDVGTFYQKFMKNFAKNIDKKLLSEETVS